MYLMADIVPGTHGLANGPGAGLQPLFPSKLLAFLVSGVFYIHPTLFFF